MKNNSPRLSFGIINSEHFFEKLEEEFKDFIGDRISARHAINCSLTSWHLSDWVFHEYFSSDDKYQDSEKIKIRRDFKEIKLITGIMKFQNDIIKECPELEFMKLISNGSKHCQLRNKEIKEKTVINQGDFILGDFDLNDFNVDKFEIHTRNGEIIDFEETLNKTIVFWREFLLKCKISST
jgi:hypothetical protein